MAVDLDFQELDLQLYIIIFVICCNTYTTITERQLMGSKMVAHLGVPEFDT
ncbi:hypothetical protein HOY82DRAFT_613978 [Tuber indicum]|nr:hypothetical protein HOY82DRAFT_613978 [Tuber indicum]